MSVWKRNENEFAPPPITPAPAPPPVQSPVAPPAVAAHAPYAEAPRQPRVAATIGPSIAIKGDVTGEEDLIIEGRIEGKILLKANSVTIGRNGRVKANVYANSITVEGEVEGDLTGKDEVVIRQSGKVKGNVAAPRVVLDSGAKFQGSIDMEAAAGAPGRGQGGGGEAGGEARAGAGGLCRSSRPSSATTT